VEVDGDGAGPFVRADRDLAKQIVVNLVQNAMRYGGEPYVVHVGAARLPGYALLQVRDGGAGVPESFVPHLFDKFARAEQASDKPGTGL
ncbi:HAMP domain-containing histidine kinase, partial [Vibrio parahaemolyticus]|nr:HAMP domain-containing histidine kinase [Vibrio parahaemolyticus]